MSKAKTAKKPVVASAGSGGNPPARGRSTLGEDLVELLSFADRMSGGKTKGMLVMRTTVEVDGKVVHDSESTYGVCQKCGCTDFNCRQCIVKTGQACTWVDEKHQLCSACETPVVKSKPMPRPGLRMARGGA